MKEEEIKKRMSVLAERGVRWTVQRYLILSYLYDHRTHPTAEEVYRGIRKDFSTISRATVYNTLELLKEYGLVQELLIEKERARYDFDVSPHMHFKCEKCGMVYDLGISLPPLPSEAEGHLVKGFQLYAVGVCRKCRGEGEDARTSGG